MKTTRRIELWFIGTAVAYASIIVWLIVKQLIP